MEFLWDIICNEWVVFILKKTKVKIPDSFLTYPYGNTYMEIYQPP